MLHREHSAMFAQIGTITDFTAVALSRARN